MQYVIMDIISNALFYFLQRFYATMTKIVIPCIFCIPDIS